MSVFDLPLSELRRYKGTNPCPDDFDDYWSEALNELSETDDDVLLVPADFKVSFAECSDLYFTGVRKARIHAKILRPIKAERKTPAVLLFHGLSANCGDWQSKLGWVAAGFTVVAMDVRGQGGSSDDIGGVPGNTLHGHITRGLQSNDPHDLLYRHIFLDTAQLARIAMNFDWVDRDLVCATGGSQGGGLTLACGALVPQIKRIAPLYPYLSDYRRVWDLDLALDAYEDIKEHFRRFDPMHQHEEQVFTKLGYIDIQNLAPRIEAETLMAIGLMDKICPPSSQYATFNKIRSAKRDIVFPDYAHEQLPCFDDMIFQFFCGADL
ncbi:MAG: acetylxylan esterase [Spirochaetes bacterium]|jgi:cephalosporin-C deacetylase|nr:acetylxylan esterase [Spirochaetota bacterium]